MCLDILLLSKNLTATNFAEAALNLTPNLLEEV